MNKFFYFLAFGLAFTVLQVATVSADTAAGLVTGANAPADCGGVPCPTGDDTHPCAAMTGDDLIACTAENPPPTGTHAGMAPALTIGDPLCVVAPALRDPGCPNAMPGTGATMAPPAGNVINPAGGGVALTIGDARCVVANEMRDPRCPNYVAPASAAGTGN